MVDLHPIFAECVAKEKSRYDMEQPFRAGEWVVATDGHICVRVKNDSIEIPVTPNKTLVDTSELDWDRGLYDEESTPLGSFWAVRCPSCNGTGKEEGEETDCFICHKGFHFEEGDLRLAGRYFDILWRHQVALYLRRARNPAKSVYFIIGEVEGVLMPCRRLGEKDD